MTMIYIIMSGYNSCSDGDELHGYLNDPDEARAVCERLNATPGAARRGTKFFVTDLEPFSEDALPQGE